MNWFIFFTSYCNHEENIYKWNISWVMECDLNCNLAPLNMTLNLIEWFRNKRRKALAGITNQRPSLKTNGNNARWDLHTKTARPSNNFLVNSLQTKNILKSFLKKLVTFSYFLLNIEPKVIVSWNRNIKKKFCWQLFCINNWLQTLYVQLLYQNQLSHLHCALLPFDYLWML